LFVVNPAHDAPTSHRAGRGEEKREDDVAIKTIRLPDGTELVIDEWLHWPTYSVMEFAAAVKLDLRAFTYVQGNQVSSQGLTRRTATEADTNQVVKSQMNFDESLLVYAITYEPFALSSATASTTIAQSPTPVISAINLLRLQRDVMVDLFVGARQQKPQYRSPFSFVAQGLGAPAWTPGDRPTAGMAFQYGTGGYPTPENERRLALPLYIQSKQPFNLRVYSETAMTDLDQDVRLRWYLDGLKRRPVG